MSTHDNRWDALVEGTHCPLCAPRADDTPFWLKVGTLEVSTLYLDRNQTYRGHCQLVFDPRPTRAEMRETSLTEAEYREIVEAIRARL
jgi:hypothetical protein